MKTTADSLPLAFREPFIRDLNLNIEQSGGPAVNE